MAIIQQTYRAESTEEAYALLSYFDKIGLRFTNCARAALKRKCSKDDDRNLYFMLNGSMWDIDIYISGRANYCDIETIIDRANELKNIK